MKKFTAIVLSLMLVTMGLVGCGGTKDVTSSSSEEKVYNIAVISKGYQHEFWRTVELGTKKAAEELGVKTSFIGPEKESEVGKQVNMVENAINQHVDAIVLAALDTEALIPVVEKAEKAGIPVVMFDSGVNSEIPKSFVATDNVAAGAIAGEEMAKAIGKKGKVAIVAHNAGTQTAIDREKGFKDAISKYSNIEIINTFFSDGDKSKALAITQDIMTTNPDIVGIYGTNEGSAVGVARAVQEKEMQDEIVVIGFDSSADEINFLEEDVMRGMVVQNPFNMGYLSVKNAVAVLEGNSVEARIDTGAIFVTKENLKTDEVQKLLYPFGK